MERFKEVYQNIKVLWTQAKIYKVWSYYQYYKTMVWYDGLNTRFTLKAIQKQHAAKVKALLKHKRVQLHKVYIVTMPA